MSVPSSVTIQVTNDAGVNKAAKDAANSLHIYEVEDNQFHKVMDGEPLSSKAKVTKTKVKNTAGVLQQKPSKNFSKSFGN
jgi:hypothetical protein